MTDLKDRVLIDTNILVYAYEPSERQKQEQALNIIRELVRKRTGVISTQVLAEFFVTVTNPRKLSTPLTITEGYERIQNFLQVWEVINVTGMIVLEAIRGVKDYQLSFWDAQIWATARLNQIAIIYSEDFNVGATLEGVRFVNPYKDSESSTS